MKKYIILISACIALALSSCVENEIPENNDLIKLDLNIAHFDMGTKAMKTGWVNGDKLNIWFAPYSGGGVYNCKDNVPDMIITYNDGIWTAGALKTGIVLGSGGYMFMVYEGYNDISKYANTYSSGTAEFKIGEESLLQTVLGTGYSVQSICTPLIVICDGGNAGVAYTYSSVENKLSSTITQDDWQFYTHFKVLIKGLNPSDANKYHLQVAGYKSGDVYPSIEKGFKLYEDGQMARYTDSNLDSKGWSGGVPDADGVAFYYCNTGDWKNVEITLWLRKYEGSNLILNKSWNLDERTINTYNDQNFCTGVYISSTKFGIQSEI